MMLPLYALEARQSREYNTLAYPKFLSLAVTWRCQSRCSTCGIWGLPYVHEMDMTTEDYERLFKDPALKDVQVIEFTGGEPMRARKSLKPSVTKYMQHLNKRKSHSFIT